MPRPPVSSEARKGPRRRLTLITGVKPGGRVLDAGSAPDEERVFDTAVGEFDHWPKAPKDGNLKLPFS